MWGSAFAGIKFIIGEIGPIWLAAIRLTGAAVLMIVYAQIAGTRLPKGTREWIACAFLGAVATVIPFALIGWASQSVASGVAGLMMAASPFLVLLISIFALPEESVTRARLVGLIVGFAGVALIILGGGAVLNGGSGVLWPYLALLLAATGYALNTVVGRRTLSIPAATRAYGALLTGAAAGLILALFTEPFPVAAPFSTWAAVGYLVLFPTFLASLLLYALLSRTSASFVSLTNYAVPATAVLLGAILYAEQLAPLQYAGFALVLAGITIAERRRHLPPVPMR
jgi:drug/metabolite transporter (DMT)-like permease